MNQWYHDINDIEKFPKMRVYSTMKQAFGYENYLDQISIYQHRVALTQFRCSSHYLEIERGRWTRPKTNIENRKCRKCNTIEDEHHMVSYCILHKKERAALTRAIYQILGNAEQFIEFKEHFFLNLMTCQNGEIVRQFAHFVHKALKTVKDLKCVTVK